jgi:predicted ArsR family transcriptional regulator
LTRRNASAIIFSEFSEIDMETKLTRRQQEILTRFLELYSQDQQPVHYSVVAEHLGVSNVTAYEMLRLLEKRGLVSVEYYLSDEQRGPGRSSVLFKPTLSATRTVNQLTEDSTEDATWERVKDRILEQLRAVEGGRYESLLSTLMARVPEQRSPMIFATEMVTALILALHTLRDAAGVRNLFERLQRVGLPGEIGLSALAGIGMALSLVERANRRVSSFFLIESGKYHQMVALLSDENRRRLGDFARQVFRIVYT